MRICSSISPKSGLKKADFFLNNPARSLIFIDFTLQKRIFSLETSLLAKQAMETAQKQDIMQYQFAHFEFNASNDELRNIETRHVEKLEPQVSQLLLMLLSNAGEVISKEHIQTTLWPNTIVEQNSLYQLLTKLRKLLNDSSRSPKFIKTVPKKGYCFIADAIPVAATTQQPKIISQSKKLHPITFVLPILIVCFSVWAFFNTQEESFEPPFYALEDVSYELGLEFDVNVHRTSDLMAYIKDINTLTITNKQGNILFNRTFTHRVSFPVWQHQGQLLAYWSYRENLCELNVISPQGALSHSAEGIICEATKPPVWQSNDELILSITQQGRLVPYLYRIGTKELVKLPVKRPQQAEYKGAISAWNNRVYFLFNNIDHTSSLISLNGKEVMHWPFPVWLAAYNPKNGAIISNDESQRHNLIASHRDGQRYKVYNTAQGIFTSASVDNKGDIYTAIESWQVNIRDKDNLPIFSTSSIDYLPVSNSLGETAFMSRRSGVCEVYLHAENKVTRLSHHKGYEYVKFLEWRPDLSMLLSNRDMDLALYDRQGQILQFTTQLNHPIKNTGWVSNDRIYAFDGNTLQLYDLQGKLIENHPINAQFVYFDTQNNHWLLLANNQLSKMPSLSEEARILTQLSDEQTNLLHNIRIKNNALYWQSSWSKQDKIWRLDLNSYQLTLVKQGNLIWHFDIDPYEQLTIARMEAIEGDIKRLTPEKQNTEQLN